MGSLTMNNAIALPPASTHALVFSSFLRTENDTAYDQATVEITTDDGANWTQLLLLTDSNWQQESADLSTYAGNNIRIRFKFDSTDFEFNNYFGWLVDDVSITEQPVSAAFQN